ncbi:hypothetical protein RB4455 [Rhodopirellula baltica SH 1]|uniref:Uncharacterized protein n=1 Tax=Rhodopirellula baltica (strain DSM 10527 / NCIMB 13988 / SH1) TaxID=243090 RepID=Q7USK2_RHOBA|nr:hypothetical protein RB4455 [Rhodopirellula baltica SH 1]
MRKRMAATAPNIQKSKANVQTAHMILAKREQQVTMLAVWRKPPGGEPEGSRPSATSLVVHVVLTRSFQQTCFRI